MLTVVCKHNGQTRINTISSSVDPIEATAPLIKYLFNTSPVEYAQLVMAWWLEIVLERPMAAQKVIGYYLYRDTWVWETTTEKTNEEQ